MSEQTVDPQHDADATPAEPAAPNVAQLQQRIAELESAKAAAEARYADVLGHLAAADRVRAEFTAARERMQRENERNQKREQVKAVQGLLPVLDTLDRSLEAGKRDQIHAAFLDGIAMVRHQFDQVLVGLGLQRFDDVGQPFDPARHQAVTTMPVLEEAADNTVLHVMASGCIVGDEVVRPAVVVVGKYAAPEGGVN